MSKHTIKIPPLPPGRRVSWTFEVSAAASAENGARAKKTLRKRQRTRPAVRKKQTAIAPEVPTVAEAAAIPGFDITLWQGLFAPRGTPKAIVTRLNTEIGAILVQPDVKAKLLDAGADVMPMAVDQFTAFVQSESDKFLQIIKDANLKPQ